MTEQELKWFNGIAEVVDCLTKVREEMVAQHYDEGAIGPLSTATSQAIIAASGMALNNMPGVLTTDPK